MKTPVVFLLLTASLAVWAGPQAPPNESAREQLARVLNSLAPVAAPTAASAGTASPTGEILLSATPDGHITHLGAPAGFAFAAGGARAGTPAGTAAAFLRQNAILLGAPGAAVDFAPTRVATRKGRHYVRLEQTYAGVPVVAGEAVVQVNLQGDIEAVLADFAHDSLDSLAAGTPLVWPTLPAAAAQAIARVQFQPQAGELPIAMTEPRLSIFAPEVLDEPGAPQLVWDFTASCADAERLAHRVLVDAHSGEIARVWQLGCHALDRRVYDGNNTTNSSPVLRRDEGDPASGFTAVDRAYVHLSEVWNYYNNNHGRDSYDGAGARIEATVRFCSGSCGCPCVNAFSGNANSESTGMVFGNGYISDDIIAHEFTHRVTQLTSGLIYTNASGAINESFSDCWGEFVDLNYNSQGDDSAGVRWFVGEDRTGGSGGRLRDMANPPAANDPDRLGSPLYQPPSNTNDNGGVHSNSGVNNKLCYLITDGDTFNGQTVSGKGVAAVADLYYEVQTDLLTSGASYISLGNALRQAAVNLGWSSDSQNDVYRACLAVEIVGSAGNYYVDKTSGCLIPAGLASCALFNGPWLTVGQGVSGIPAGNTLMVRGANYNEPQTIRKAMTLRGYTGTVNIGKP